MQYYVLKDLSNIHELMQENFLSICVKLPKQV